MRRRLSEAAPPGQNECHWQRENRPRRGNNVEVTARRADKGNYFGPGGPFWQRVMWMQKLQKTRGILGLASVLAIAVVIVSTSVLVQRRQPPLASVRQGRRLGQGRRLWTELSFGQDPAHVNCSSYGCLLQPVETSRLNVTAHPWIASRNHLLLTHKNSRTRGAPPNQDRAVLVPHFHVEDGIETATPAVDPGGDFFLGLFDGHRDDGEKVAQFASEEIPSRLTSELREYGDRLKSISNHTTRDEIISKSMSDIFTQIFRSLDSDISSDGGTAAAIILRRGSHLYFVNCGDSTMYVAIYRPPPRFSAARADGNEAYLRGPRSADAQLYLQGTVAIAHRNEHHKAHHPDERIRVRRAGGLVHLGFPPLFADSRVIVGSISLGNSAGLRMSRSLGDRWFKEVGVIPDPNVTAVDLRRFWAKNDIRGGARAFVVAGSAGLFDELTAEVVAQHLAFGLFESPVADGAGRDPERDVAKRLVDVGKKLIAMAGPAKGDKFRTTDDMTFVAHVVEL